MAGTETINPALASLVRPMAGLRLDPRNARAHNDRNLDAIAASLASFGQQKPIAVLADGTIVAGNGTFVAAQRLGWAHIAAVTFTGDDAAARAYALADNRTGELSAWDPDALAEVLRDLSTTLPDPSATGFSTDEIDALLAEHAGVLAVPPPLPFAGGKGVDPIAPTDPAPSPTPEQARSLVADFGVPPFSVLDTRQGYWQARKRDWLSLGIRSEIGRADGLAFNTREMQADITGYDQTGTSVFDPVVCELVYRWFSLPGHAVLDPFAGGSVRGVVAGVLGRGYTGIDLRPEQVAANAAQWSAIGPVTADVHAPPSPVRWVAGDAAVVVPAQDPADLIFTCPPYGDLERYSDDPRDLSTMDAAAFARVYGGIIAAAVARLKPERFAVVVVGDYRDARGAYVNFVGHTVVAFQRAGMVLVNEAVLVNPVGSGRFRVRKQFVGPRKLLKLHQNLLVFWKGDPRRVAEVFGPVPLLDAQLADVPEDATDDGPEV